MTDKLPTIPLGRGTSPQVSSDSAPPTNGPRIDPSLLSSRGPVISVGARRFTMRLVNEELIVRNEDTYDEFSGVIDLCVCSGAHSIFTYPRAIEVIRAIIDSRSLKYTIDYGQSGHKVCTVTFNASTKAVISANLTIDVDDSLTIDCKKQDSTPESRAVVKLDSTVTDIQEQIKQLRASFDDLVAQHTQTARSTRLIEEMRRVERRFGAIPPGLYAFAESIMDSQIRGTPRQFAAISTMDLWITRNRSTNIRTHMISEPIITGPYTNTSIISSEQRHFTSLMWIPAVIHVFSCNDPLWDVMLRQVNATRIIISAASSRYLAMHGDQKKTIQLSPAVRSVVLCIPGTATAFSGIWTAISAIIDPRDGREIILPQVMHDKLQPDIVVGGNVKYVVDTSAAELSPTSWHTESLDEDFARAEATTVDIPLNLIERI